MFKREEIEQILDCARAVDEKYELFGSSTHKYKLNSPIQAHMLSEEVEEFSFARQAYEENPDHFFGYEKEDENELCDTDGYFTLGTHGCQWDFGLIITGDKRGQVFDYDNEGAYSFVANSFTEFYQKWLDRIADTKGLQKELEERRKRLGRRNFQRK